MCPTQAHRPRSMAVMESGCPLQGPRLQWGPALEGWPQDLFHESSWGPVSLSSTFLLELDCQDLPGCGLCCLLRRGLFSGC